MSAFWPYRPDTDPIAAHLNSTPKLVATRTPAELTWQHAQVLDGELAPAITRLKAQGSGSIAVLGSGLLVQDLVAHDLVDGYRLFVHPLLLGTGKRLFRETERPVRLRLADCTRTSTGVVLLDYRVQRDD